MYTETESKSAALGVATIVENLRIQTNKTTTSYTELESKSAAFGVATIVENLRIQTNKTTLSKTKSYKNGLNSLKKTSSCYHGLNRSGSKKPPTLK